MAGLKELFRDAEEKKTREATDHSDRSRLEERVSDSGPNLPIGKAKEPIKIAPAPLIFFIWQSS
jgi:hypothetical protein